jgi:hypothetical protein
MFALGSFLTIAEVYQIGAFDSKSIAQKTGLVTFWAISLQTHLVTLLLSYFSLFFLSSNASNQNSFFLSSIPYCHSLSEPR